MVQSYFPCKKYPKPCKDTIRRTFQTLLPNSNWSVCCWTNTILGRESIDFYVFLCKSSEHICVWNPDSIRGNIFRLKCPKGRSFYRVSFETSQQWPLLINLQLIHRETKTKPAKLSHLSAGTWNNKRRGPFMWTMERRGAIVYQNITRGVQHMGNSYNILNSIKKKKLDRVNSIKLLLKNYNNSFFGQITSSYLSRLWIFKNKTNDKRYGLKLKH